MAGSLFKYLWSNVELVYTWCNIDVRASITRQNPSISASNRCRSEETYDLSVQFVDKIMLWAMAFARFPFTPASSAFTLLCCLLSLLVWSVAVMGLHHMRQGTPVIDTVTSFWGPIKEKPFSASWTILPQSFRVDFSTEDNYQAFGEELEEYKKFCDGKFVDIRSELDYTFHKVYTCQRQQFQDKLIETMLGSVSTSNPPSPSSEEGACVARRNWIVFTAGVMGAGKSYTMKQLHDKGRFPLDEFVKVDPDNVRHHLPEFELYIQQDPETAGFLTRKEAGVISEIAIEAALRRGQNVLVDGTLRNSTWYQSKIEDLRERYPLLQIGILHVTAPREAVIERAMVRTTPLEHALSGPFSFDPFELTMDRYRQSRAKVTGRVVPRDLLESVMLEVPKSIEVLSKQVDVTVEIRNAAGAADVEIATEGITWDSFQQIWQQSCFS